jgi:hypothetical protein
LNYFINKKLIFTLYSDQLPNQQSDQRSYVKEEDVPDVWEKDVLDVQQENVQQRRLQRHPVEIELYPMDYLE